MKYSTYAAHPGIPLKTVCKVVLRPAFRKMKRPLALLAGGAILIRLKLVTMKTAAIGIVHFR